MLKTTENTTISTTCPDITATSAASDPPPQLLPLHTGPHTLTPPILPAQITPIPHTSPNSTPWSQETQTEPQGPEQVRIKKEL